MRFLEDPVRMLRAVVFAARLDFDLDEPILDAIRDAPPRDRQAAPPRLVEEYFKILRSGYAEKTFRMLKDTRLLREITPELDAAGPALWESLGALDAYRQRFPSPPDTLTNAILVGTLLVAARARQSRSAASPRSARAPRRAGHPADPAPRRRAAASDPRHAAAADGSARAVQARSAALLHRHVINEALTWLEVHGGRPEVVQHWRSLQTEPGPATAADGTRAPEPAGPPRPHRRRRRRRRRYPSAAPQE